VRLVNAQRQLRERGRIRIGYSTPSKKREGVKVPHRLDTFRFTAPDEQTVREVAALYGGEPEPWPDGGRDRFQVVTGADSVNVILPAGMAMSQAYEQYAKGFAVVRCDGEQCWTPGGSKLDVQPCVCDPDNRDCQLTTMVSVILPDLGGLGTFRLVTHSWYGAMELGAAVDLIESAMAVGMRVPARLFLTHREVRRLINGKPEVRKFPVPALDLHMSVAALGSGGSGGALSPGPQSGALVTAPESAPPALPSSWQPVDQQALPTAPPPDVRGILADNDRPARPRANAAPPIASTGATPRTEAEAVAATPDCSVCGLPYGTAKLVKNPEPGGSRFVHAHHLDSDNAEKDLPGDVTPSEGDRPAEPPPPADEEVRGGGGVAGAGRRPGAQPAPTAAPPQNASSSARMMTTAQGRKVMALCAEVWPALEGMSGAEVDEMRRENLLALVGILGQPGLTSRTQIDNATAPVLLDALEELKAGTIVMTDAGLVDTTSGEVMVKAP
jgi:hypothetical protein